MEYNFDNIRSFRDNEVNAVLNKLLDDTHFKEILKILYPDPQIANAITKKLRHVTTVHEFQKSYVTKYNKQIIAQTMTSFTHSGFEQLDKSKHYLYVTNHRDIILDPALLNEIIINNGLEGTEIAIGSNLLIFPWIRKIVRINKSFIVMRNLSGREMLTESKKLSAYIRDCLVNRNNSVWISQREGRTKDGDDRTSQGVLKMFNFSGEKSFIENFEELNIVPVTISYEYEPCDREKAKEMYIVKQGNKFVKTTADDLRSMGRGLYDKKGRVHFAFGTPINNKLASISTIKNVNKRYNALVEILDDSIHSNYNLLENNYIAYDILYNDNGNQFAHKYTAEQKKSFVDYANKKLNINGNENLELLPHFYEIYANPLRNSLLQTNK